MTDNTEKDPEQLRWLQTEAALASVQPGECIDEKTVSAWLESWGDDCEKTPLKRRKPR